MLHDPMGPPDGWRPTWFYNHVPDLGLNVCLIPKNACKTVKRFLLQQVGYPVGAIRPASHLHRVVAQRWSFSRIHQHARAPLMATCRNAIFLRHPLYRLASAYLDKVVWVPRPRHTEPLFDEISEAYGLEPGEAGGGGISFREFVLHCARTPDDRLDEHWKPQSAFARNNGFDFVGDVARMGAEMDRFADWLGLEQPHLPRRDQAASGNWSGPSMSEVRCIELRSHGLRPPAAALFTPGLADIALDRYRDDLDLLEASGLISPAERDPGILWQQPKDAAGPRLAA